VSLSARIEQTRALNVAVAFGQGDRGLAGGVRQGRVGAELRKEKCNCQRQQSEAAATRLLLPRAWASEGFFPGEDNSGFF